jgi:uncharacterized protein with NRDE domain
VEWWTAAGEEILGGKDELGGGTWLGCTKAGKLAFLTNVREPSPRLGVRSRGELPVRFLQVQPCQFPSVSEQFLARCDAKLRVIL